MPHISELVGNTLGFASRHPVGTLVALGVTATVGLLAQHDAGPYPKESDISSVYIGDGTKLYDDPDGYVFKHPSNIGGEYLNPKPLAKVNAHIKRLPLVDGFVLPVDGVYFVGDDQKDDYNNGDEGNYWIGIRAEDAAVGFTGQPKEKILCDSDGIVWAKISHQDIIEAD